MSNELMHYRAPQPVHVETELHLGKIVSAIWKSKFIMLVLLAIILAVTFVILSVVTPIYKSGTRVLISQQNNVYTRSSLEQQIQTGNPINDQVVQSQVQLILSRDLLREVLYELELQKLKELNPTITGVDGFMRNMSLMLGFKDFVNREYEEDIILQKLTKKVEVFNILKTNVIGIDAKFEDPVLAASVANLITKKYIERQKEFEFENTKNATVWLKQEIDSLRKKVKESEEAVQKYRAENNLFSASNNQSISNQRLVELNTQLSNAQGQQAEFQAKASLINEFIKKGSPLDSRDVLTSPTVQRLIEQRNLASARVAQLRETLLPSHPRVERQIAQVRAIDRQIETEALKLAKSFENDARISLARIEEIRKQIADQASLLKENTTEQSVLQDLEREALSSRRQLENLLVRYRDAQSQQNLHKSPIEARIIASAAPSAIPYFPKKGPILLGVSIVSLILMILAIFTREIVSGRAFVAREIPVFHDGSGYGDGSFGYSHKEKVRVA